MKFLIILLLSLISFGNTNAQELNPKKYVIGGRASFQITNNGEPFQISFGYISRNENSKRTNYKISPFLGYQISPHWLLGTSFSFGGITSENNYLSITSNDDHFITTTIKDMNSYNVGLFSRYTFNPESKLKFHLRPYISYNQLKGETNTTRNFDSRTENLDQNIKYVQLGTSFGISYDINKRFRVLASMGSLSYKNGTNHQKETAYRNEETDIDERESSFDIFKLNMNFSTFYFGFEMMI